MEAFVTVAEAAIEHICLFYHDCGVNDFDDVIELAEQVLQFSVLLEDLGKGRGDHSVQSLGVRTDI